MRILHAIAQEPGYTGSGMYVNSLISNFENVVKKQALIAGINKNQVHHYPDCKELSIYPVEFNTDNVKFNVFGMSDIMPYPSEMYSNLTGEKEKVWNKVFDEKIDSVLVEFNPDIVLVHHLWLLCTKFTDRNLKVYGFCHGTDLRQIEKISKWNKKISESIQKLRGIFVPNEKIKQILITKYNVKEEKLMICPAGYNNSLFSMQKSNKNNRKRIVYAGKWSYSKGFPYVIETYNRLKRDMPEIELHLYGSGFGKSYNEFIEMCELSKDVYIHGQVNQKKLSREFNKGNLFLMPSQYETQGLVIIEALACGMPVVVSDLEWVRSSLKNIADSKFISWVKAPGHIGEKKYIICDKFVDELVKNCKVFLKYNQKNSIVKEYGKIETYSWENIAKKILDIIKKDLN